MDSVELERFKLGLIQRIRTELLKDFAIPANVDFSEGLLFLADEMVVRVHQDIFGQQVKKLTISYPADWWQALRERWFPAWWLARWPVRKVTHTVDVKALYPDFALPGHRHVMHMIHRVGLDDLTPETSYP